MRRDFCRSAPSRKVEADEALARRAGRRDPLARPTRRLTLAADREYLARGASPPPLILIAQSGVPLPTSAEGPAPRDDPTRIAPIARQAIHVVDHDEQPRTHGGRRPKRRCRSVAGSDGSSPPNSAPQATLSATSGPHPSTGFYGRREDWSRPDRDAKPTEIRAHRSGVGHNHLAAQHRLKIGAGWLEAPAICTAGLPHRFWRAICAAEPLPSRLSPATTPDARAVRGAAPPARRHYRAGEEHEGRLLEVRVGGDAVGGIAPNGRACARGSSIVGFRRAPVDGPGRAPRSVRSGRSADLTA